ncbi:uncharacterized protein BT62DRAFT_884024 [Guyanagaster necrorhizus]|uniref:Uncharacterized protein n=1 Tax=Guyanagaster necrorhizus TaxID=856835 RepID=A0A9P7W306_9AGAR|nr:uncharacterized protein BT62DRAFT_884024 [Guyanagaster necrorhizus MCA 3950]KAG7451253.1 hypothetical protein BT62DRAFT_884024 [Guyanagaster necrorhizus MCA 3950]
MSLIARRAARVTSVARLTAALALRPRTYAIEAAKDPESNDDYPKVPSVSRQYLPATGWQDPLLRRNFGDPVHEKEELYSMWGPDIPTIAPHIALRHFTYAAISFVSFGFLVKYALIPEMPAIRREYPFGGLVTELGGVDANKVRYLTGSGMQLLTIISLRQRWRMRMTWTRISTSIETLSANEPVDEWII